ncbi:MAG: hypothetical protein RMA76_39285 [Deltaproteobacteria bacterium]|jgi:hypothetical protein
MRWLLLTLLLGACAATPPVLTDGRFSSKAAKVAVIWSANAEWSEGDETIRFEATATKYLDAPCPHVGLRIDHRGTGTIWRYGAEARVGLRVLDSAELSFTPGGASMTAKADREVIAALVDGANISIDARTYSLDGSVIGALRTLLGRIECAGP